MMNRGVSIHYGDVAPEAKENFVPLASEKEFDNLNQLQQYNLNFKNIANPCELYSVVLDGWAVAFPSAPETENIGLYSKQISKKDGTFETPIELVLESDEQYSSQGFTLTFDTYNEIYATRVNIKWIRKTDEEITELWNEDFFPDSAFYFCRKQVDNYNKVVMTFYSINMPYNRLNLRSIDYGYGTVFYGKELRNVKLTQEIDPISSQISINTADFTLDSKTDIIYSFQSKQPLSINFNGKLKATTFVKKSTRKASFLWQIQAEDYIGLLDSIPYYGGIYSGEKAIDVLADIFAYAKVPFKVDDVFNDATIYGYIPYTTCRDAIMQVAFAIRAVVDTSNSDVVKIFALDNEIKQVVPLSRIMQGQNFADEDTVTGVEVAMHTYTPISESTELYKASESGTGQNIFIKFSEPIHSLKITNGSFAIDENGKELKHTNYAVINAESDCVLSGKKYEHTTQTKRKNNPLVLASTLEKIVSVETATLVSANNINDVLESCYKWLSRTNSVNLKIVEGKHVKYGKPFKYGQKKYGTFKYGQREPNIVTYDQPVELAERINAETQYLGIADGIIIKQSFGLNGNNLVKEVVLK